MALMAVVESSSEQMLLKTSPYNVDPYTPGEEGELDCTYDDKTGEKTCVAVYGDEGEKIDDNDDDDEPMFSGDDECFDNDTDCPFWAGLKPSECEVNADFMLQECRLSCRVCERHKRYSDIDPKLDGSDLGESQELGGDETITTEAILERIAESQEYMKRQVELAEIDPELLRSCRNKHDGCTFWSLSDNECEKNPAFMKVECGPACFSCDMLSIEKRCPMDRETIGPDVWGPGDLEKMFRRLSSEEPYISKYNVTVLSSPDNEDAGPWVLTLDNFVTDDEAERLISLGAVEGYERSTDIGAMKPDGTTGSVVSNGRTSTNAWCSNECLEDEMVQMVNQRISNMTGIPEENSEDLQLLRYEVGQKYNTHHDYIEYETDRQGGVRLITVYLYLNDVEAGGGTNFPDLGLTVMPKRGRVLIWPSVVDSDPNQKDNRTDHQALPVEAGLKYGANAWLHMRSFKGPNNNGC